MIISSLYLLEVIDNKTKAFLQALLPEIKFIVTIHSSFHVCSNNKLRYSLKMIIIKQ